MKVINKKTGKDVTSKVIKIIEKSLIKSGFIYYFHSIIFYNTNQIRLLTDNIIKICDKLK